MSLTGVLFILLICGFIAAAIARAKNLSVGQGFFVGAVLGIVGILIVACQRRGLPKAPPGMKALECPRCNAVQNVPDGERVYDCWQCATRNERWAAPPAVATSKVRCHACQHRQDVPLGQERFVCGQCGTRLRRKASTPPIK